jgi:hypothetical protein
VLALIAPAAAAAYATAVARLRRPVAAAPGGLPADGSARAAAAVLPPVASHDTLAKLPYAWDLPTGAGPVAARHRGAELMYYGGTVVDVALAAIVMAQWYAATGRSLARARRRPTPRSLRLAHDDGQPGAAAHMRSSACARDLGACGASGLLWCPRRELPL